MTKVTNHNEDDDVIYRSAGDKPVNQKCLHECLYINMRE